LKTNKKKEKNKKKEEEEGYMVRGSALSWKLEKENLVLRIFPGCAFSSFWQREAEER
jgi:hypothetical protein